MSQHRLEKGAHGTGRTGRREQVFAQLVGKLRGKG